MNRLVVGLPVYNAMPFLPAAVESLLSQTHRAFELVAIDDGSTDASLAYLRSLSDPRLTVLSQPNAGLTATLNRLLELAGDGWLVRHDADDIARPDRLAVLAENIERFPDAAMFYTAARYHQEGRSFGSFRTTVGAPDTLRLATRAGWLLSICHPTAALHAPRVRDVGGYRFDLHAEDVDLWWRLCLRHDIRYIPRETIGFRLNHASVSSSRLAQQAVNVLYVQYLLLSELWQREPRPHAAVAPALESLVSRRQLRFRDGIRRANVSLGSGRHLRALGSVLGALAASPGDFARRVHHEMRKPELALLGEDPRRFVALAEALW